MKKMLGALVVLGVGAAASAQTFNGRVGFVSGHIAGSGPLLPGDYMATSLGTHQLQLAFGAFDAQGFTNYGMFNWIGSITLSAPGITIGNAPGNRAPFTISPAGNGVVGPGGITGIDTARNVINITVPWPEGQPEPPPPTFTQGNNAFFNTFRFTITATQQTQPIVLTATGAMQAISGWTFIGGEPGEVATYTATSFVTDQMVSASLIVHTFIPGPGAAAVLCLGGLAAARRRRGSTIGSRIHPRPPAGPHDR